MHFLLWLLLSAIGAAQAAQIQISHTTENLRGVSVVSRQVAWASGTHGTYLRTTDGGLTWIPAQVPDATTLDFRAVVAFSADEAFLMSAGPGEQSRIYHTTDAGQHWKLQYTNSNPKGFFDSMAFWDPKHGIVLGDPLPDEKGKLKFELLETEDGESWHPIPPSQLPEALPGEGAFAASNSCIAILHLQSVPRRESSSSVILSGAVAQANREQLRSRRIPTRSSLPGATQGIFSTAAFVDASRNGASTLLHEASWKNPSSPSHPIGDERASALDPNIWFASGGKAARVFHSRDRGKTWEVFSTPILHGPDSAGIFSISFRDALHGVIAGGDYKHPDDDGPNLAFTEDGGKTWTLSPLRPQAYFSAVAYDQQVNAAATCQKAEQAKAKGIGKKLTTPVEPQRLFIVGEDFVLDFRPPSNPRRISGNKKTAIVFNAVSAYPEGGALVVGPKGTMAIVP